MVLKVDNSYVIAMLYSSRVLGRMMMFFVSCVVFSRLLVVGYF